MSPRARLVLVAALCALWPSAATAMPRSYLAVAGGADVLLGNVEGDVIDQRLVGQFELGIGTHLGDRLLLEATFGILDPQQQEGRLLPHLPAEGDLPDHVLAYRIEVNPMMLRLRYARSGMRKGYLKPEFQIGLGLFSVTRWLRPAPAVEPPSTNQLLPALEIGACMLLVLDKNWMAVFGPRYTLTKRSDLVDDTRSLDGVAILFGLRFFLNSPRDPAGAAPAAGLGRR